MICNDCHFFCELADNEIGKCKVIKNIDGKPINIYSGQFSNIAVEPIEKRPFFHFMPNSRCLSVGLLSCPFSCAFCFNSSVSQFTSAPTKYLLPEQLISLCKEKKCSGIVFTYNEPTLFHEYICELGKLAQKENIPIAIKTNGFATEEILEKLVPYVSAFNVDIKGDEESYKQLCGGRLGPVLSNIEFLVDSGVHVEVSYLVTPIVVDNVEFHRKMASWLSRVNDHMPVHLLYYYPAYKVEKSYEMHKLIDVYSVMSDYIGDLYISNVYNGDMIKYRNTYCCECEDLMVSRNRCTSIIKEECCGRKLDIVWTTDNIQSLEDKSSECNILEIS